MKCVHNAAQFRDAELGPCLVIRMADIGILDSFPQDARINKTDRQKGRVDDVWDLWVPRLLANRFQVPVATTSYS